MQRSSLPAAPPAPAAVPPFVLLVSILLLGGVAPPAAAGEDWPQFRGARGSGGIRTAGRLEGEELGLSVAWRVDLGSGYSGVVAAGGRVATMFSDGSSDLLAVFDERSGEELWRYRFGDTYRGHDGSHDGPLSTPLIAGDRLVALGPRGKLVALDAETGKERWSVELAGEGKASPPFYGFATSPILVPGAVVVQSGAPEASVAAYDLATGERRWGAGEDSVQYSTPLLLEPGGRRMLVAGGMSKILGVDPASGNILWEYAHEGGGGGYGASKLVPVAAGEGRLLLTHKSEASAMVRLTERDGVATVEKMWENRSIRHSYAVPVYHDGHIYAFSARFLTCVDAETGQARWKSRRPGDGFLILVDDRLVIITKDGSLHVAAASPEGYDEIASLRVFDEELAWSHPSFSNGHILVRSLGELARVSVGDGRTVIASASAPGAEVSGTGFGRFLSRLETTPDRQKAVDEYLDSLESLPLVEGDRVTFLYSGPGEDLALEGEMFGIAVEERMIPVEGTNLFYYSMPMEPDARLNYVLVRDYQEILDPRNPRTVSSNVLGPDMELALGGAGWEMSWFAMPDWKPPSFLEDAPPERRGRVEDYEMESPTLEGKLPLKVYLPAGYAGGDRRYPVVYVHGGDGALDQGGWSRALDNLLGRSVEPLIVVFLPAGQIPFPQYAPVFAGEVVPFVDGKLRTRTEPEARASVGMGLAAGLAFFGVLGRPGLVGKLATQGAFLTEFAWGPVQGMVRDAGEQPLAVYMDWGRYDLMSPVENWSIREANREAVDFLRRRGYEPAGGEVNEGSGWASWRNRTGDLLESLFPLRKGG